MSTHPLPYSTYQPHSLSTLNHCPDFPLPSLSSSSASTAPSNSTTTLGNPLPRSLQPPFPPYSASTSLALAGPSAACYLPPPTPSTSTAFSAANAASSPRVVPASLAMPTAAVVPLPPHALDALRGSPREYPSSFGRAASAQSAFSPSPGQQEKSLPSLATAMGLQHHHVVKPKAEEDTDDDAAHMLCSLAAAQSLSPPSQTSCFSTSTSTTTRGLPMCGEEDAKDELLSPPPESSGGSAGSGAEAGPSTPGGSEGKGGVKKELKQTSAYLLLFTRSFVEADHLQSPNGFFLFFFAERAAQNRAAQRAFRERKQQQIRCVCSSLPSHFCSPLILFLSTRSDLESLASRLPLVETALSTAHTLIAQLEGEKGAWERERAAMRGEIEALRRVVGVDQATTSNSASAAVLPPPPPPASLTGCVAGVQERERDEEERERKRARYGES